MGLRVRKAATSPARITSTPTQAANIPRRLPRFFVLRRRSSILSEPRLGLGGVEVVLITNQATQLLLESSPCRRWLNQKRKIPGSRRSTTVFYKFAGSSLSREDFTISKAVLLEGHWWIYPSGGYALRLLFGFESLACAHWQKI